MTLLRLRFAKLGKVRFTSHRDVARIFERSLRRAEIPVAYTQGFSPRPKVSFGLALSTGHESLAEYLDVALDGAAPSVEHLDPDELAETLTTVLPTGMAVVAARILATAGDSLQQAVTSCSWEIEVPDVDLQTATGHVDDALAADSIVVTRERKGKEITEDLRPHVLDLEVTGASASGVALRAELGTQPRGLRPSELLEILQCSPQDARVRRTHQWIDRDGARTEPIVLDRPLPDEAGECRS